MQFIHKLTLISVQHQYITCTVQNTVKYWLPLPRTQPPSSLLSTLNHPTIHNPHPANKTNKLFHLYRTNGTVLLVKWSYYNWGSGTRPGLSLQFNHLFLFVCLGLSQSLQPSSPNPISSSLSSIQEPQGGWWSRDMPPTWVSLLGFIHQAVNILSPLRGKWSINSQEKFMNWYYRLQYVLYDVRSPSNSHRTRTRQVTIIKRCSEISTYMQ